MRSGKDPRRSVSVQAMKRPVLAAIALITVAAAPATASAASLQVASPSGTPTTVYAAAPGEVNALDMHGPDSNFKLPFFEFSAPLTVGPGCAGTNPTLCDNNPIDVSLGDMDDVANTNTFGADLTMTAGAGDDDVLAGGLNATADGGSGADTMLLAADFTATGTGGSGRDRLAAGLGAFMVDIDGGDGNDLVVPNGTRNTANGGSGKDRLVSFEGLATTLSGGPGSDLLVGPLDRLTVTLDGGSGNDLAYGHAGGMTVTAGSGYDVVDVRGGASTTPDTVTCGSGLDIVWADAADTVAGDCEFVLRRSAAPMFRRVATARSDAQALLAHRPDPSAV
jgi:Ca2+-binding RTX toxin-like protein